MVPQEAEMRLRAHAVENFGEGVIPEDMMTIQDYPMSYDDLEPFMARFERVAGVSGKAGNLNSQRGRQPCHRRLSER